MELWEKYRFTIREKKIWELAKAYIQINKKRGNFINFLPTSSDPRKSKYWPYFEQAFSIFENESTFDPYMFVEAQYRNVPKDKILYPAQFKTKVAIENYREHREAVKIKDEVSETERILINLANTYKFFKKWWKKNELQKNDYESFFAPKDGEFICEGMNYCIQGFLSKYFLAVSKTFNKYYKQLDPDVKYEIIDPEELKEYRVTIRLNKDAYDFAKEIFLDEVV